MPDFVVKFSNTLLNSDGFPSEVLQRSIRVRRASTATTAAEQACRRFEQLENVPDWRLRAHCITVEPDERIP